MSKGAQTRLAILDHALDLSSEAGLDGLTIGVLAKRMAMSKSGLYAHFDSKQRLQVDVLDRAAARFVDAVIAPALKEARGLPRIERLFALWLQWGQHEFTGGCPFIAAASEFDDRPGPVRDALRGHLHDLLGAIERAATIARDEGHFRADLDVSQFAYEFWATLVAFQHYKRLLGNRDSTDRAALAFSGLLDRSAAASS